MQGFFILMEVLGFVVSNTTEHNLPNEFVTQILDNVQHRKEDSSTEIHTYAEDILHN